MDPSMNTVESELRKLLPDLERVYTDIHAHPELSMQETRTAGLAADRLRAAGFDVTSSVGQTGVVGVLRNGDGPTVMARARETWKGTLRPVVQPVPHPTRETGVAALIVASRAWLAA